MMMGIKSYTDYIFGTRMTQEWNYYLGYGNYSEGF